MKERQPGGHHEGKKVGISKVVVGGGSAISYCVRKREAQSHNNIPAVERKEIFQQEESHMTGAAILEEKNPSRSSGPSS